MTFQLDYSSSTVSGSPLEAVSAGGLMASNLAAEQRSPAMPLAIPADQAYYWSAQWRESEAEARAELARGEARSFDDPTDAVRYLLSDDE